VVHSLDYTMRIRNIMSLPYHTFSIRLFQSPSVHRELRKNKLTHRRTSTATARPPVRHYNGREMSPDETRNSSLTEQQM